jgi:hypothetical protein
MELEKAAAEFEDFLQKRANFLHLRQILKNDNFICLTQLFELFPIMPDRFPSCHHI